MPTRIIQIDGRAWRVFPAGHRTPNEHDEFGLLYVAGSGSERTIRVTRYSPVGARSREQSLHEMSDDDLRRLFQLSQPGDTSPEAGYVW